MEGQNLKCVVVTNALRANTEMILSLLGINNELMLSLLRLTDFMVLFFGST